MSVSFPSASNYTDIQGLQNLKNAANNNSPDALREAARQFEALFIQNMLKNMRAAKLDDGLLGSDQGDMYLDMFDKQLSLTLTEQKGIGLADMLYEQLKNTLPVQAAETGSATQQISKKPLAGDKLRVQQSSPVAQEEPIAALASNSNRETTMFSSATQFVQQLWPIASEVAKDLGTSPKVLLAQAALETGWGKYILHDEQGVSSFNLFNIKARSDWQGPVVTKNTMEYLGDKYQQKSADFKIYSSFADSFEDYFQHIQNGVNYQSARSQAGDPSRYAQALQQAGYATDPNYSQKIIRVMQSETMKTAVRHLGVD